MERPESKGKDENLESSNILRNPISNSKMSFERESEECEQSERLPSGESPSVTFPNEGKQTQVALGTGDNDNKAIETEVCEQNERLPPGEITSAAVPYKGEHTQISSATGDNDDKAIQTQSGGSEHDTGSTHAHVTFADDVTQDQRVQTTQAPRTSRTRSQSPAPLASLGNTQTGNSASWSDLDSSFGQQGSVRPMRNSQPFHRNRTHPMPIPDAGPTWEGEIRTEGDLLNNIQHARNVARATRVGAALFPPGILPSSLMPVGGGRWPFRRNNAYTPPFIPTVLARTGLRSSMALRPRPGSLAIEDGSLATEWHLRCSFDNITHGLPTYEEASARLNPCVPNINIAGAKCLICDEAINYTGAKTLTHFIPPPPEDMSVQHNHDEEADSVAVEDDDLFYTDRTTDRAEPATVDQCGSTFHLDCVAKHIKTHSRLLDSSVRCPTCGEKWLVDLSLSTRVGTVFNTWISATVSVLKRWSSGVF